MTLYRRLADAKAEDLSSGNGERGFDPLSKIKRRIHQALVEALGPKLYDTKMSSDELGLWVHRKLGEVLASEETPISAAERQQLIRETTDDILGHGPIERYLRDTTVTEIMVNGAYSVYIERDGKLHPTNTIFLDEGHLRRTMERIVGEVGRRIDESQPYVDARLPDGSRVNAVIPPISLDGPVLTVRKFSKEPYRVEDLVTFGTVSDALAEFLSACVRGRINTLVSGGTGAGKTTSLDVISSFIPEDERIVTIEDAAELRLQQPHVVRLEYRPPNIEGRGEVTIRDLVRNSLRMRPDRIVVGEVRGAEALDMLQAMNTGHEGSISTIHANSPRDVLSRLETMCLMAGMDLPMRAIRQQIASAIELIVHQARLRDGTRRITQVTAVTGMEGDVVTLEDIFSFDFGMGVDDEGRYLGHLKPTGIRPKFVERLADHGIHVDAEIFESEMFSHEGSW